MNRTIDPDIYGADLRVSCVADFLELEAFTSGTSRTEADLADYIGDFDLQRLLEPRYKGGELDEYDRPGESQERSRERASAVFTLLEQRESILGERYPFEVSGGRRLRRINDADVYLWYLFVSLSHALDVPGVPVPSTEFEKIVAVGLSEAGLPSLTVGTSTGAGNFQAKVNAMTAYFAGLVATVDDVVISRHQNDGAIDSFGMFECGSDKRHGQWAFIGQSTVGKSESWLKKIYEPNSKFWSSVFGQRLVPIPFFATPHHIQDDYLISLSKHDRCMLDRIRLVNWTQVAPASFAGYEAIMSGVVLE